MLRFVPFASSGSTLELVPEVDRSFVHIVCQGALLQGLPRAILRKQKGVVLCLRGLAL